MSLPATGRRVDYSAKRYHQQRRPFLVTALCAGMSDRGAVGRR
jgi:hypothetical protein